MKLFFLAFILSGVVFCCEAHKICTTLCYKPKVKTDLRIVTITSVSAKTIIDETTRTVTTCVPETTPEAVVTPEDPDFFHFPVISSPDPAVETHPPCEDSLNTQPAEIDSEPSTLVESEPSSSLFDFGG